MMNEQSSFCCPICLAQFNNSANEPRIVPLCGHSLCLSCITRLMVEDESIFKCPICQRRIKFQRVELNCFPKNYGMAELVEKFKNLEFCKAHQSQIELVCLSCKAKVCSKCIFKGEHKGHEVELVDDFLEETSNRVKDLKEWIGRFNSYFSISEKYLNEQECLIIKRIENKYEEIIKNILSQKETLKSNIRSLFGELKIGSVTNNENIKESCDIFDLKEKILKKIQDWENNSTLNQAFDLNSGDFQIINNIKCWLQEDQLQKFQLSLKELPKRCKTILQSANLAEELSFKIDSQNIPALFHRIDPISQNSLNLNGKIYSFCRTDFLEEALKNDYHNVELCLSSMASNNRILDCATSSLIFFENLRSFKLMLSEEVNIKDQSLNILLRSILKSKFLITFEVCIKNSTNLTDLFFNQTLSDFTILKSLNSFSLTLHSCKNLTNQAFESLSQSIKGLSNLENFQLQIEGCLHFTNRGVALLVSGLKQLHHIHIINFSFIACNIGDEGANSLLEYFIQNPDLTTVHLGLKSCSEITGKGFSQIANKSISSKIKSISLNFEACKKFSESGLLSLSSYLQKLTSLESLDLNFDRCLLVTDDGILKIFETTKDHLISSFGLSINECNLISSETVKALSLLFTQLELSRIMLNMAGLQKIESESFIYLAESLLAQRNIKILSMNFSNINSLTDEGIIAILNSVTDKSKLESLKLEMRGCTGIGNLFLKSLSKQISELESLKSLYLDMNDCIKVSDGGISPLGIYLPALETLEELYLGFRNCKKISDESSNNLSQSLSTLQSIKNLKLDLYKEGSMETEERIHSNTSASKDSKLYVQVQNIQPFFCIGISKQQSHQTNQNQESK